MTVDYIVASATWHGTEWSQYSGGYRLTGPSYEGYWLFYSGASYQVRLWWDGSSNGEWDWEMLGQQYTWYNSATTQVDISQYQYC